MELTRRNLIGGTALVAGAAALSSLNLSNAVAQTAEGAIFEGSARGMRGDITVHVTLDGERLVNVQVVRNTESPAKLSQVVVATMPAAMVEAQSVNVDTVNGATISSMALVNAVNAALEAAGVPDLFQGEVPAAELEPVEDAECDILVLGAGHSGCTAAVAARWKEFGVELNDLKVMLVEEQGFIGGTGQLSMGKVGLLLPLNDPANLEKNFEQIYVDWTQPDYPMSRELLHRMVELSGKNVLDMQALGMPMYVPRACGNPEDYEELLGWYSPYYIYPPDYRNGNWPYAGVRYREYFDERIYGEQIEVRLNTEAKELVVEDGAVTGVVVEGPAGTYTIHAKKVILATGGFSRNAELMQEYCPELVNTRPWCAAGCNGDGFYMAQAVDAVVDGRNDAGLNYGVDAADGFWGDLGNCFPRGANVVMVNNEGKRFIDESLVAKGGGLRTVVAQPDGEAFSVFDANNPAAALVEASERPERVHKADTIEELAELMGVPTDALVKTLEDYNAVQASGDADPEFEVPNESMLPVVQAPFYAVPCYICASWTQCGLRVGDHLEVLNSNNEIVPNLYAVGEMAYTGTYMTCLTGGLVGGRIAAEHARDSILGA